MSSIPISASTAVPAPAFARARLSSKDKQHGKIRKKAHPEFEVYSEAQKRWLEVSSVSNFESFQANRLKLRYRDADKKTQLAHTLNGSSLALPRIVAALLENFQTPDGIRIPEALIPYTGFDIIK